MSIKILRVTTDDSRLILFLLVSIVLHIGILFVVPQAREAKKVLPRLIPVDVIELPKPAEIQEKKPEVRSQKPAPANSKIKPALSVKQEKRIRRHKKIRKSIFGTKDRPRLCVFRSNQHIYAQLIIDDEKPKVLMSVSDKGLKAKKGEKKLPCLGKRPLAGGAGRHKKRRCRPKRFYLL